MLLDLAQDLLSLVRHGRRGGDGKAYASGGSRIRAVCARVFLKAAKPPVAAAQFRESTLRAESTRPMTEPARRERLFAPLPVHGPWTMLQLSRTQFLLILAAACALYAFAGGPLWRHLGDNDFLRIAVSYAIIPPAVALALHRNRALRVSTWLAASGVIAALKLLLTALLALALGIAGVGA
ncbi:MAG: hypothetical protein AB1689_05350 [Thermodesulfobacteriota bacterium]